MPCLRSQPHLSTTLLSIKELDHVNRLLVDFHMHTHTHTRPFFLSLGIHPTDQLLTTMHTFEKGGNVLTIPRHRYNPIAFGIISLHSTEFCEGMFVTWHVFLTLCKEFYYIKLTCLPLN